MGFTTNTARLNFTNVSVRCQSVSRMAFETNVPSVIFSPNRGNVEKKVSSTEPISSLASRLSLATFKTTGVSFSGVKTKFKTIAITAMTATINVARLTPTILNALFTCFFMMCTPFHFKRSTGATLSNLTQTVAPSCSK